MAENEINSDADSEQQIIASIENFLRPLEKQSREELDRMFEKAKECIEYEKQILSQKPSDAG